MLKNRHITKIASAFIARWKSLLGITGILLLSLLVISCADAGDDDTDADTFAVGGTVSGLAESEKITLTLTPDGGTADEKKVTGNDNFTFDTKLAKDATYTVAVKTPPAGKTCTVDPADEQTMGEADVTDVAVACVVTHDVKVTVSGLENDEEITLILTHGEGTAETLPFTGAGNFDTKLAQGTTYTVSVVSSPRGKTCTSDAATEQTMGEADVTITVACVVTHDVKVTVSGLAFNERIDLTLTPTSGTAEDGRFTSLNDAATDDIFYFTTTLAQGTKYTVSVKKSPAGKTCIVDPATEQTMGDGDATITVDCVVETLDVKVRVSGLAANEKITLTLTLPPHWAGNQEFTGDGIGDNEDDFTFDTTIAKGVKYTVSIKTPPTGKTCTVDPATEQTMGEADVTIKVTCSDTTR